MAADNIPAPIAAICSATFTLVLNFWLSPKLFNFLFTKARVDGLGIKKPYLHSILASSVHAIAAVVINAYCLSTRELNADRVLSTSYLGTVAMYMSLGYSMADFFTCVVDKHMRRDLGMVAHHLAMICGIGMGLHYGYYNFFVVYRFLSEFSTPWVNLWWTVHNLRVKGEKLYVFASLAMMATFFACRVAVIPWHNYALQVALHNQSSLSIPWYLRVYMLLNFGVFDILNVFWFYKMLKGAYKLFCGKKKRAL